MRRLVVTLLVLLAVLHQDWWWRFDERTLVFGFMPVSLAWHVGISILACVLWGLTCCYAWPRDVDVPDDEGGAGGFMRGGH